MDDAFHYPNGSHRPTGYSKIEMAAMDGTGRTAIITSLLHLPRSITVDHPLGESEGRIYWTDEYLGKIESASLNGSDRQIVMGRCGGVDCDQ